MPGQKKPGDDPARRLEMLERGTTADAALAFYDALPPVQVDEMVGWWRGRSVPTGSPLDGMLERFGWRGKRFGSAEDGHPLVFADGRGRPVSVNPALLPVWTLLRMPSLMNTPVAASIFRLVLSLLRTREPRARLRMVEVRGVVTATLIYDAHPIMDAFRKVDGDTMLGLMDLRGLDEPFFFSLRREDPFG